VAISSWDVSSAARTDADLQSLSFMEMLTKSRVSKAEPRCGRDYGGVKCSDTKIGRFGECCSKYGFCGKKPFHCVERLGCQSDCNNDLDIKLATDNSTEAPTSVVAAPPDYASPKVIIKHISMAIPLCEECAKPVVKKPKATNPPKSRFAGVSVENALRAAQFKALGAPTTFATPSGAKASGVPVPAAAQIAVPQKTVTVPVDDGSVGATVNVQGEESVGEDAGPGQYAKAISELRAMTKAAEKRARQIVNKARKLAKKVGGREAGKDCKNCTRTVFVDKFGSGKKVSLILADKEDPLKNPLNPIGY